MGSGGWRASNRRCADASVWPRPHDHSALLQSSPLSDEWVGTNGTEFDDESYIEQGLCGVLDGSAGLLKQASDSAA